MSYSGGSSTNAGIQYQNWFLALQISYAFFETNFNIYPEMLRDASILIDDVVVDHRNSKKFYSAKFRPPNESFHWSQSTLHEQDILSDFKKQLELTPESEIFLVSESNCYLFAEVFLRARNAVGPFDIHKKLDSEHAIDQWERAKHFLKYDDYQMINFSNKINVRVLPICEMKTLVKHRFNHLTDYRGIEYFFFDKAIEASKNKTLINKLVLNRWFNEEGIELKYK